MAANEKSQFVKEIESRLDALFGEEARKANPDLVKDKVPESSPEDIMLKGTALHSDFMPLEKDREFSKEAPVFETRFNGASLDKEDPGAIPEQPRKLVEDPFTGAERSTRITGVHDFPKDDNRKEDRPPEDKVIVLTDEFSDIKSILHSPLKDLKASVLSLEWEITPPIMKNFDDHIKRLEEIFSEDKIALGYLRIMRFLGRYIQVKGRKAHPQSVTLLISVYNNLESITLSARMAETRKWDMLMADIDAYKKFVEQVDLLEQDIPSGRQPISDTVIRKIPDIEPPLMIRESLTARISQVPGQEQPYAMPPHEAFALALEEIKKMISAEFSAIRAELKMWRETK